MRLLLLIALMFASAAAFAPMRAVPRTFILFFAHKPTGISAVPVSVLTSSGLISSPSLTGSALKLNAAGPTYWDGEAPPSSVLGVGEKIPSTLFGPLSLLALVAGTYCVHESNIFHQLSASTVNPQYIVGSLLVPISWGMHVAAWIQKKNGK